MKKPVQRVVLQTSTKPQKNRDIEKSKVFFSRSGFLNGYQFQGCTRLAVKLDFLAPSIPGKVKRMREEGIRAWAQSTMGDRMGSSLSAAAVDWWVDYMGRAPKDSVLGIYRNLASVDITADLSSIVAPTLVMTATRSGYYGSVEAFGDWSRSIPHSEFATVEGDSYHISASYPDACARKAAAFIARHASGR